MTRSAALLLPDRLISATELRSAALDGEVVPVGEGFLPIDTPVSALARAASLAPLLIDERVVIADRSAAWVWGWGPEPAAVTTCVAITARIPSPDRRRLRAREVVIDDDERRMLGPVAVTTPLRTLLDLARHDEDAAGDGLLAAGIRHHGIDKDALEAELTRRPSLSFVKTARARLLAALACAGEAQPDQPLLTR
ncbi:MAG: hypothetical protein K2X36_01975 [Microbacteriaceae bacterium]|nr:hypothetical protein [Microbacteriaceae bacterium]